MTTDPADDMCPNCVTPWKCNGPHLTTDPTARSSAPTPAPVAVPGVEQAIRETLLAAVPSTNGVIWEHEHEDGQREPVTIDGLARMVMRHVASRPEPVAGCDTCNNSGRVPWMIEADPNCYQQVEDDGTIPCPDCHPEPVVAPLPSEAVEWAEQLRQSVEKCCQCTDGHHDQIGYIFGTEQDVHVPRDIARRLADLMDRLVPEDDERTSAAPVRWRIEGTWLVEEVNHHTCGTGPDGHYGAHEPGCGLVPVVNLLTLPGWPTPPEDDTDTARAPEGEVETLRRQVAAVRSLAELDRRDVFLAPGSKVKRVQEDRRRDLGAIVTTSMVTVDDVRDALDGTR